MSLIPSTIDGAQVICFALLDSRHRPTGNTKHTVNGDPATDFYGLAICQYDQDENSFYLFYCDGQWQTVTDTWHESIENAKKQAEFEFENISQNWIKKNEEKYQLTSPNLVGLEGPECPIPKCDASGRTVSTGYLEVDKTSSPYWYMEFTCPLHGPLSAYVAAWNEIITAVLKDELK